MIMICWDKETCQKIFKDANIDGCKVNSTFLNWTKEGKVTNMPSV